MMNPFVRKAVRNGRKFPAKSALLSEKETLSPDTEWLVKKNVKTGAITVDDHLRIKLQTKTEDDELPPKTAIMKDVFAMGDNASVESATLPATAQVANQQAIWLGKRLNRGDLEDKTFNYKNLGIMAYLGN